MAPDGPAPALMRVLVTGGTGFLGGHVVRLLESRGHQVTVHANRGTSAAADTIRGDLSDPTTAAELLGDWRWDAVIDLAGPVTGGSEDLRTGIDVVTAHANIALHVRRYARTTRVVHASSMTVYGAPQQVAVDEDHPRRPTHLYGLAKRIAEDVLQAAPELDAWIVRLPGLFSERRKAGALYHFCRAARAGEPLVINAPVPTPWNILHVEDAAVALVEAVTAPGRGQVLNVSYGEPIDLVSVATQIASIAGTGASVVNASGVTHPPFLLVAARAARALGWTPPSLTDRLTRLYEAYAAA